MGTDKLAPVVISPFFMRVSDEEDVDGVMKSLKLAEPLAWDVGVWPWSAASWALLGVVWEGNGPRGPPPAIANSVLGDVLPTWQTS